MVEVGDFSQGLLAGARAVAHNCHGQLVAFRSVHFGNLAYFGAGGAGLRGLGVGGRSSQQDSRCQSEASA